MTRMAGESRRAEVEGGGLHKSGGGNSSLTEMGTWRRTFLGGSLLPSG